MTQQEDTGHKQEPRRKGRGFAWMRQKHKEVKKKHHRKSKEHLLKQSQKMYEAHFISKLGSVDHDIVLEGQERLTSSLALGAIDKGDSREHQSDEVILEKNASLEGSYDPESADRYEERRAEALTSRNYFMQRLGMKDIEDAKAFAADLEESASTVYGPESEEISDKEVEGRQPEAKAPPKISADKFSKLLDDAGATRGGEGYVLKHLGDGSKPAVVGNVKTFAYTLSSDNYELIKELVDRDREIVDIAVTGISQAKVTAQEVVKILSDPEQYDIKSSVAQPLKKNIFDMSDVDHSEVYGADNTPERPLNQDKGQSANL